MQLLLCKLSSFIFAKLSLLLYFYFIFIFISESKTPDFQKSALRAQFRENWSGGAGKPARGMRISCARRGGSWGCLSSVRKESQLFQEKFRISGPESSSNPATGPRFGGGNSGALEQFERRCVHRAPHFKICALPPPRRFHFLEIGTLLPV